MTIAALNSLSEGAVIPFGGDRYTTVPAELAAAFRAGDQLHVVQSTGALLHVPAAIRSAVAAEIDAALDAFARLRTVPADAVQGFYTAFADMLAADVVWERIQAANAEDVLRAEGPGAIDDQAEGLGTDARGHDRRPARLGRAEGRPRSRWSC